MIQSHTSQSVLAICLVLVFSVRLIYEHVMYTTWLRVT